MPKNASSPVSRLSENGGIEADVELPPGFPKTEAQALARAMTIGCPDEFVLTVWHETKARGGTDWTRQPISSWPDYLSARWRREQSARAERKARNPSQKSPPASERKFETGQMDISKL
jgi:hypothetical protein